MRKLRSFFFLFVFVLFFVSVISSSSLSNAGWNDIRIEWIDWYPEEPYGDESVRISCRVYGVDAHRWTPKLKFRINGGSSICFVMEFDTRTISTWYETIGSIWYKGGDEISFWIIIQYYEYNYVTEVNYINVLEKDEIPGDTGGEWISYPYNPPSPTDDGKYIDDNSSGVGGVNIVFNVSSLLIIFLLGTIVSLMIFRIRRRRK